MLFTTTLLALSTVATGVKAGKTYMVDIMNGSFYPDITTADEGDIVAFNFVGGTYGIVQASYASPCSPLIGGMFSGYYDSSSAEVRNLLVPLCTQGLHIESSLLKFQQNWTWNVNVTNKEPVFFYAADQCQQGMVGVINPPQWLLNCLQRYPEVAAQYPEPSIPKDTPASGGYYEQQPPAVPEAHGFPYAPFSNSSAPPKIVYQSPCPPPIKEEAPAVNSPMTTIFTSSCSEATIVTVPGGSVYNATAVSLPCEANFSEYEAGKDESADFPRRTRSSPSQPLIKASSPTSLPRRQRS